MMRKLMTFMIMIILVTFFTACASKGINKDDSKKTEKKGGTFVISLSTDPISYNPDSKYDDNGYVVNQNIFSRLVKVNIKNKVIPDLAESWDISDDSKVYTFYLAKGVKWHDGVPFTSADVKWTFEEIIKKNGVIAYNLANIQEITTPDDNTVVFKLKEGNAAFLGSISLYNSFIMPKHIYEGTDWDNNEANKKPIGTGPFKFVKSESGVSVELEANKDYFKGAPNLDRLVFKIMSDNATAAQAFYNGELDALLAVSVQTSEINKLRSTAGITPITSEVLSYYNVSFNLQNENFKKLEVRQAFALGMDRQEILDKAQKGVGTISQGYYPPSIDWAFNEKAKVPDRNVVKARELLEKAGYKKDKDGNYFSVELLLFTMEPLPDIATVIKENMKEIGIDIKLNTVDWSLWSQKVFGEKNFEATLLAGYLGPDPAALGDRFITNASSNFQYYSNPQVDKLLKEAVVFSDKAERGARYKEVQQILADEMPLVPITNAVITEAKKDYVKGYPSDEAYEKAGTFEYTYVTIEK